MIAKFTVKNHKSIREEAALDFEIDTSIRRLKDNWSTTIGYGKFRTNLLKCLIIYGHNGSGKSNMLDALQNFITTIFSPDNKILTLYDPYFFASKEEPSEFTIEFYAPEFQNPKVEYVKSLHNNDDILQYKRYSYSICIGKDKNDNIIVLSEKYISMQDNMILFEIENGIPKKISKILKKHSKGIDINYNLEHNKSLFYLLTHFGNKDYDNAPIQNLHFGLQRIARSISLNTKDDYTVPIIGNMFDTYITLFQALDINISKLEFEEVDRDELLKMLHIPKKDHDKIPLKENEKASILFAHHGNKKWDFNEYESYGTQELLKYMASILIALQIDTISIIDELKGVHTNAVRDLLKLFQNYKDIEVGRMSQFILGTHDSNLLDSNFFRPDQIYFAEKHENQSQYYSLSDFENINKAKNWQQMYLNGRFGGVKDNIHSINYAEEMLKKLQTSEIREEK